MKTMRPVAGPFGLHQGGRGYPPVFFGWISFQRGYGRGSSYEYHSQGLIAFSFMLFIPGDLLGFHIKILNYW